MGTVNEIIIESPLFYGESALCVSKVPVNFIINGYKKYGVDVSEYFLGINEVSIFECKKSGYRFYHPENITGDSEFYEILQKFEWYYMPWKWEHESATSFIADDYAILEIGCAHGAFLKTVSDRFNLSKVIGLELNESVVNKSEKIKIFNTNIQDYAVNNEEKFDVVCSYQVLEHIANIRAFLESAVRCLKQRGRLIISVPNNTSFLGEYKSVLNMPPHHMGLWSGDSLKFIADVCDLKLVEILYEPLQDYHIDAYINVKYYKGGEKIGLKIMKRIDKLTGQYKKYYDIVRKERHKIQGVTVLAVFEK